MQIKIGMWRRAVGWYIGGWLCIFILVGCKDLKRGDTDEVLNVPPLSKRWDVRISPSCKNVQERSVYDGLSLWVSYLDSGSDSSFFRNPYWAWTSDMLVPQFYLFRSALIQEDKSGMILEVVGIKHKNPHVLQIKNKVSYRNPSNGEVTMHSIVNVYVQHSDTSGLRLLPPMRYITAGWQVAQQGHIRCTVPPDGGLDVLQMQRADSFNLYMASLFGMYPKNIHIIQTADMDAAFRTMGYDYRPEMALETYNTGLSDLANAIIYSYNGQAYQPEEIARQYVHYQSNMGARHPILEQGVCSFLGKDKALMNTYFEQLATYMEKHPEEHFEQPISDWVNRCQVVLPQVPCAATLGALIAHINYEREGFQGLRRLVIDSGMNDEDFYRKVSQCFGVDRPTLRNYLLSELYRLQRSKKTY